MQCVGQIVLFLLLTLGVRADVDQPLDQQSREQQYEQQHQDQQQQQQQRQQQADMLTSGEERRSDIVSSTSAKGKLRWGIGFCGGHVFKNVLKNREESWLS